MRCLHITDARLLRKTARLPDYSKENFAMAFDSFLMKRFSTTLCSLADEERPGSEMHVVVLLSDHKCSHQCLDQRVDTLIAAKLPEVNEIHFISGIKPAHSPLRSHCKEVSAQKRSSQKWWLNLNGDLSKRVWDIPHSPICCSCMGSKNGITARGKNGRVGKCRARMPQQQEKPGKHRTSQARRLLHLPCPVRADEFNVTQVADTRTWNKSLAGCSLSDEGPLGGFGVVFPLPLPQVLCAAAPR